MLLEVVTYQVKEGVSGEELIKLSNNFEMILKRDIAGFVRRELTKCIDSNRWIELLWWDSESSVKEALVKVTTTEEFAQYCEILVDNGGEDIKYFSEVSISHESVKMD